MDKAELIRRLMSTFLVELEDHVRVFNRELLALEQGTTGPAAQESVKTLFRTVHSLKGASRSVEAQHLARACHALEELLAQMRDGTRILTPELFALMFQAADAFAAAGKELGEGTSATGGASAALDMLAARFAAERVNPLAIVKAPVANDLEDGQRVSEPFLITSVAPSGSAPPSPASKPASAERAGRMTFEPPPGFAGDPASRASLPPARPTPPPTAAADSGSAGVRPLPSDDQVVVRIPLRRLDALLTQSGELTIARRRLELRREELEGLYENVAQLRTSFRGFGRSQRQERQRAVTGAVQETGTVRSQRWLEQAEGSFEKVEGELERLHRALDDDLRQLERAATPLERQVQRVRLQPFIEACEGLQRAVRDLAQQQQKTVELMIQGAEIELDRAIIEAARPALLHLVRNAIDHGIE
ncbi:MAG: Hpt domain-containing protein, partial [Polyangiales bacterium]